MDTDTYDIIAINLLQYSNEWFLCTKIKNLMSWLWKITLTIETLRTRVTKTFYTFYYFFFNIPPSLLFKNLTFNPASSEKVSGWKPVRWIYPGYSDVIFFYYLFFHPSKISRNGEANNVDCKVKLTTSLVWKLIEGCPFIDITVGVSSVTYAEIWVIAWCNTS